MNDKNEEKLEKEQEEILMKFLEMMPDSSQETILTEEDREKMAENENVSFGRNISCRKEEHGALAESEEVPCTSGSIAKNHEENTVESQWKTRNEISGEENDSGFATSSEQLLKVSTPDNVKEEAKFMHDKMDSDLCSDSQDSCKSMESVSLLQNSAFMDQGGNNESDDLCMDFPFPPYDEGEMQIDEEQIHSIDNTVQTLRFVPHPEGLTDKTTDFIKSLINLKYIVLPDKDLSAKKYLDLFKNVDNETSSGESDTDSCEMDNKECSFNFYKFENVESSVELERNRDVVSHKVLTNDMGDIMLESVETILVWLKNELKKNSKHFCSNWHGSAKADAMDMVIAVVDVHSGLARTEVSNFLFDIFDEIYASDSCIEDSILECKMTFLSCFCKSVLLSYDLIEHVSGKLHQLVTPQSREKFKFMALVKKNYFSLRLLSDLLRAFLNHLQTEELQSVFGRKSREEELTVLNLWMRDRRSDSSGETDGVEMCVKYLNVMARWCHRTDHIFHACLRDIPLLLKSAHTCNLLAQDIIFYLDGVLKKIMSST